MLTRFLTIAAATLALAAGASAQVLGLGAIGDSLTDEYTEESYGSYARNWTVQLVQNRGVNMGPTAAAAAQPGGTWGEPRRTGYRYNWARYGADSSSALTQGQHTGLAGQVTGGSVSHAVVAIGANDFSPTTGAYFNIYWGLWSQSQIDSYVAGQIADVAAAVQALDAAGAKIVLCNYVDFGIAPVTRQLYTNATRRNRVTAAIAQVNAGLVPIARQHHAVLVDLASLGTTIFGTNTSLRQFLRIGNVDIQLFNRDTTSHGNPLAGFVDDGAHPHTTIQGVFANQMMTALNIGWGAGLAPFTDQEILAHGGLTYGGSDTLAATVGAYNRFVRNFYCPPDVASLGGAAGPDGQVTVDDLVTFLQAFFAGNLSLADVASVGGAASPDGQMTVDDLVVYLAEFFAGCP